MNKIKYNFIFNYAYFISYAAVNFLLNPILLVSLGPVYFGAWKTAIRYYELINFLDGRSSQALKWMIASEEKNSNNESKSNKVNSAIYIFIRFLPVFITALLIVTLFFEKLTGTDLSPSEYNTILTLCSFLALNSLIVPLYEICDSIFVGLNRAYVTKTVQLIMLLLMNLVYYIVINLLEMEVYWLAIITLIFSILNLVLMFVLLKNNYKWVKYSKPEYESVKKFFDFSKWILSWSFIEKYIISIELILISFVLGFSQNTIYILNSFVAQFGLSVTLLLGSSIMPYLGSIFTSEKKSAINLLIVYKDILLLATFIISVDIIIFNQVFIDLWVGHSYYIGDLNTLIIVASFIQVTLIRSDAQITDMALLTSKRVKFVMPLITMCTAIVILTLIRNDANISEVLLSALLIRLSINLVMPYIMKSSMEMKIEVNYKLLFLMLLTLSTYIFNHKLNIYDAYFYKFSWLNLIFFITIFSLLLTVILLSTLFRRTLIVIFENFNNSRVN